MATECLERFRLKTRFSHPSGNTRTVTAIWQYRSGPRHSCKTAEIFLIMASMTSEEASPISVMISPSVKDFSYQPSTSVSLNASGQSGDHFRGRMVAHFVIEALSADQDQQK